tara:strand:- start:160 stop:384 length:225 start_codon:yes stop_codon:yes gene_type:complete
MNNLLEMECLWFGKPKESSPNCGNLSLANSFGRDLHNKLRRNIKKKKKKRISKSYTSLARKKSREPFQKDKMNA